MVSKPCQHKKLKTLCSLCGGGSLCKHNKRRDRCRECGGKAYCQHNKRKDYCYQCGGKQICKHMKKREQCRDCGGSSFCKHNKSRAICKDCKGTQLCIHLKQKHGCPQCCTPRYLLSNASKLAKEYMQRKGIVKSRKMENLMGCSAIEFKTYIQQKMDGWNATHEEKMTFENTDLDHIKPASIFTAEDMEKGMHYTNMQPLLSRHNSCKSNKWGEHDEAFWRANIIHNPSYKEIYWPLACPPMD